MGVLSYLPTIPRARMQHSKKVISYIPMIPSYVFLCLNDSERTELKKREKRIVEIDLMRNIIMEDLLIRELNILQQCEQLSSRVPIVVNPGVVAGDRVIIKSGELAGYETVVVSRDDEHNIIIVNLTILNKHVEYSVR